MTRIRFLLRSIGCWWRGLPPPLRTTRTDEIPENPDPRVVYLVGESANAWLVVMTCQCGCRDPIYLSLVPDDCPTWEIERHRDGTVSLSPSVHRTRGCRSHFWVRRGQIELSPGNR